MVGPPRCRGGDRRPLTLRPAVGIRLQSGGTSNGESGCKPIAGPIRTMVPMTSARPAATRTTGTRSGSARPAPGPPGPDREAAHDTMSVAVAGRPTSWRRGRTAMSTTEPVRIVASVDELLAGATDHTPLAADDGKSGNWLERVRIDGQPLVAKHQTLPRRLDHARHRRPGLLGLDGRPGRPVRPGCRRPSTTRWWPWPATARASTASWSCSCTTWGPSWCPKATRPFPLDDHRAFLDHMAQMHARRWGWTDDVGLQTDGPARVDVRTPHHRPRAGPTRGPGPRAGGRPGLGLPARASRPAWPGWSAPCTATPAHWWTRWPPPPSPSCTGTGSWGTWAATPTVAPSCWTGRTSARARRCGTSCGTWP